MSLCSCQYVPFVDGICLECVGGDKDSSAGIAFVMKCGNWFVVMSEVVRAMRARDRITCLRRLAFRRRLAFLHRLGQPDLLVDLAYQRRPDLRDHRVHQRHQDLRGQRHQDQPACQAYQRRRVQPGRPAHLRRPDSLGELDRCQLATQMPRSCRRTRRQEGLEQRE